MGCNIEPDVEADIYNFRQEKNRFSNKRDPNFPDMEEWPGERYKGIGIKRMKGYKCDLPIDKLNEMREKFWTTKIEENENWRIIQQICVFDEERANMTLGRFNFEVAENCVNHIIGSHGEHYFVPNYCINDPYFEKELKREDVPEKKIKLFLYDVSSDTTVEETFSNHDTGEKIKNKFIQEAKIKENEYKIRLFFSGSEIKNSDCIYQHGIEDNFKIQVMKIRII
jgi:hypothetical protein